MLRKQGLLALGLALVLGGGACSYRTPPIETPPPSDTAQSQRFRIEKSFFADVDSNRNVTRYKTFSCGWSPETVAGPYGNHVFAFYNHADHCNIEFRITEDALVGRLVNPSFPTEPDRWHIAVKIPITKHFYLERERDKYDRETNREIENTARDHWTRRPYMTLDLSRMEVKDWAFDVFWDGQSIDYVEDVELDTSRGFLGFTATAHSPTLGSRMEAKIRVNFLAFEPESTATFQPTPYNPENAKYLNILHVLGQQVNGNRQVLYGARWDTRRNHTIYLNGFPPEYVPIAEEVVQLWNNAFEEIGQGRPFRTEVRQAKYAFDLRYPGITWVSDKYLSLNAPLGVGMVTSDVRNGKVLWGGVTLWGGMIDKIINSYTPSTLATAMYGDEGLANESMSPAIQFSLMEPDTALAPGGPAMPPSLSQMPSDDEIRQGLRQSFEQKYRALGAIRERASQATSPEALLQALSQIARDTSQGPNPVRAAVQSDARGAGSLAIAEPEVRSQVAPNLQTLLAQLAPSIQRSEEILAPNSELMNQMVSDYKAQMRNLVSRAQALGRSRERFNMDYFQSAIGQPQLSASLDNFPFRTEKDRRAFMARNPNPSKAALRNALSRSMIGANLSGAAFDADRRLSDVAMQWRAGLASNRNVNRFEAQRVLVKDLLLHEVGHMLGLGHNFKENILPARGSVPDKYLDGPEGLTAKATQNETHYHTVMGYKNGLTDVLTKYEDLKPGPNDLLVLRYLYNKQYPVFPKEARDGEDYKFVRLPADGIIEEEQEADLGDGERTYRVAYFPSCNDVEASYSVDPYCNRWDRGHNAVTLMKSYFEDYKANLTSQLYAFASNLRGGAFWYQEYYLWRKSLNTFGRARIFYDYMRQKYANQIQSLLEVGPDQRLQNLLQFSKACVPGADGNLPTENAQLNRLFSDPANAEFRELCEASGILMKELANVLVLPGPDRTRLDYFDSYSTAAVFGGDVNSRALFENAWGRWREMARTPLKIPALYTITSPMPFASMGGWLMPVMRYSRQDGNYLLNTLYAQEFSEAIEATVSNNLSFANSQIGSRTVIGNSVLSLGYMLSSNYLSNDSLMVDQPFLRNNRDQTLFTYNVALVEIERRVEPGNQERARKFTGTIHQFFGRGSEQVPEIYLFSNDRTVMMPPQRSLIYPVSPVRWFSNTGGYYYVIKLDYQDDYYDPLKGKSVRQSLERLYHETMRTCIQGSERNGLRYFFNDSVSREVFPGFYFPDTIASSQTDKNKFYDSLESEFSRYYSNQGNWLPRTPDPRACDEALRGQGLLVLAASAINGYYLFDLYDYIEKGF